MSVQQRGVGVSTSRKGGLRKELTTRCETWWPAAGHPSDGSRGDRWNYPHPEGTRPSIFWTKTYLFLFNSMSTF